VVVAVLTACAWFGIRYQLNHMDQLFFQASWPGRQAIVLYLAGDYGGAVTAYRRHFAAHPRSERELNDAGHESLLGGDFNAAKRKAQVIIEKDADNEEALLTLAEVALHEGDSWRLSTYVQQILKRDSEHADALALTSFMAARAGSYDKAIEVLERTLRTSRAAQRDSVVFELLETMAMLEDLPSSERPYSVLALYARYLRIYDPSNGQLAIRYARRAIANNDRPDSAYVTMGVVHHKSGRKQQAVQAFQEAIRADPSNALAYWWASFAYGAIGDLSNEYLMSKAATNAAPGDPFFGKHLIYVLMEKLGDVKQAVTYLQAAVMASPEHVKSRETLAYALDYSGRYEEAVEQYRHTIRLDPLSAVHYESLAVTLDHAGRWDDAVETLKHAVDLFPSRAATHARLADLFMDRYRGRDAAEQYEVALQLGSFEPMLCKAYSFVNKLQSAVECFQRILKDDPSNQYANRNLPEVAQALQYQRSRR
jgi:tetratricopeptide (TPR) repeat protein